MTTLCVSVSSHHASIEYSDGAFYITDTSTNGVFLDSKQNRLARGQPSVIRDGDTIIIEPFHIQASIIRGPARAAAFHPMMDAAPREGRDRFRFSWPREDIIGDRTTESNRAADISGVKPQRFCHS